MGILEEGIESGEEFSHGGDEGGFEGFSGSAQAFVKELRMGF